MSAPAWRAIPPSPGPRCFGAWIVCPRAMTAKSGGDILVLDEVIAEMFGDAGPGNRLIEGWRDQEAALREHGPMVRVLVTGGTSPIDDTILDCLPRLGLIACLGAGFEGIDLQATGRRVIGVVNAPGRIAPAVAVLAFPILSNPFF